MRFSAALALGSACCLLGADAQFNKGVRASDFVPAELDMRKMAANFKRNHKQPGQLLPLSLKKYDSYKTNLEAAQHAAARHGHDDLRRAGSRRMQPWPRHGHGTAAGTTQQKVVTTSKRASAGKVEAVAVVARKREALNKKDD